MTLSLDGGATWNDWEPYVTSKKVILSAAGDGLTHIIVVQVKFRDLTGNPSLTAASASASYTKAQAPASITVPALDADGTYTVTWDASPTAGVTYLLQEATNDGFTTGLRTAYSGTAVSASITSRVKGLSYYYRVQARKTGYESSSWTTAGNSCNVGQPAMPASITVPTTDADGNYTVSWGASATPGVSYVLEEATDKLFATATEVCSGTARICLISGNAGGGTVYYYRVKAQNAGFVPDISSWKNGANGCKVGS
jgi:hypothetical protein